MVAAVVLGLFLAIPVASAHRDQPSALTREDALPAPVANVTQDPWMVRRGDDVAVYARLHAGWDQDVASMTLRYCRVEPTYVCWPLSERFQPVGDSASRWAAVLPWNPKLVDKETIHVGYNISLAFANGSVFEAPTVNYNEPPTFPLDSGGMYFFYHLYGGSERFAVGGFEAALAIATALAGVTLNSLTGRRSDRRAS